MKNIPPLPAINDDFAERNEPICSTPISSIGHQDLNNTSQTTHPQSTDMEMKLVMQRCLVNARDLNKSRSESRKRDKKEKASGKIPEDASSISETSSVAEGLQTPPGSINDDVIVSDN